MATRAETCLRRRNSRLPGIMHERLEITAVRGANVLGHRGRRLCTERSFCADAGLRWQAWPLARPSWVLRRLVVQRCVQGGRQPGGDSCDGGAELGSARDVERDRDRGQPFPGIHRRIAGGAGEDASLTVAGALKTADRRPDIPGGLIVGGTPSATAHNGEGELIWTSCPVTGR